MRALAMSLLLLTGCGFAFEPSSEPIDLRILAVRSEPAELVAGGPLPSTVTVSALVVDPRDPGRVVPYAWRACVPGFSTGATVEQGGPPQVPGGNVDTSSDPRCPADATDLASGSSPLDALSVTVPVPGDLAAAVQGAAAQGLALSLYVNAELTLDDGGTPLFALKRVPVSPQVPAGRIANENPSLVGLLFNGQPWDAGAPLQVRHGACPDAERKTAVDRTRPGEEVQVCGHRIEPVFDEGEAETYRVKTFAGEELELRERLRFAWFVEHGSLSLPETEQPDGIGPERYEPLVTTWNEPPEKPASGTATLWVVVRDGRGGTSWERREVIWE